MDYYYSGMDLESEALLAIGYSKRLYDEQVDKVKKEEYIKNVLLEDYVCKIRAHKSRYDYIPTMFGKAQSEIGKKLKKERTNLETIKSFVIEDFFGNDKKFKLDKIISCGYENYAWRFEFKGYGKTSFIEIPMVNNITAKNVAYANDGMFSFGVYESEHCYGVLKKSYEIKAISDFIKEYFAEATDA